MIAVKSALSSYDPGSESAVGEIYCVKTNGVTDTEAHNAYKREKDRIGSVPDRYNVITCKNISEMVGYISSNYSGTSSVWSFLKDRGFNIPATDSRTNLLLADSKLYDDGALSADGSGYGEYTRTYYLKYKAYVRSLSSEDVCLYALVDKKVRVPWAYQVIAYNHYYRTYIPSPVNSKPASFIYFTKEDPLNNVSEFSYDARIDSIIVTAKAKGATGRQTVRVQYRENDDDSWTTSYAPTTVIPMKDGGTLEVRTIISDESGQKDTSDTQYITTPKFVEGKAPYVDSKGEYILGVVSHFEKNGKNYAVNADGSMGAELTGDLTYSYFDFELKDGIYSIVKYTGSYDTIANGEMIIPKTYKGIKIDTIGDGVHKVMDGVTGTPKQFSLVLNENIEALHNYSFHYSWVNKITGDTSGLDFFGNCAIDYIDGNGTDKLDIELKKSGSVYVDMSSFKNRDVTVHLKHSTKLGNDGWASKMTYVFTDAHTYGEPVWTWSDDHSGAKAAFTCTNSKCKHQEILDAAVTKSDFIYKASVEFEGKTYTDTYIVPHTHTYGEPVWNWSEIFSKATLSFTCIDCDYKQNIDAKIAKNEENGKTVYTATAEWGGKTYTDTVKLLLNTSAISAERIGVDESATISCSSEDGLGKVLYTVSYSRSGHSADPDWYPLQTDSENTTVQFRPADLHLTEKYCVYTIKVEASNILSDGSRYTDTKTFDLCVENPFLNTSDIIGKIREVGSNVYISCSTKGSVCSSSDVLFSVYYKLSSSDEWTTIVKRSKRSSQFYFIPKEAGQYDVRVDAIDVSTNEIATNNITIYAVEPLVNTSTVTANTVNAPIVVNCSAEGGTGGNYLYTVYYRKYAYTTWDYVQTESENTTVLITPTAATKYEVMVAAISTIPGVSDKLKNLKKITVSVAKGHTYGEPTWTWSDDHSTAKATFTCTDGDDTQTVDAVIIKTETMEKTVYTAEVSFNGKTYTDTKEIEQSLVYYPAAEPYIDNDGAYILGYKEHYKYKGKYYAVNADKSVGEEIMDIWISYFEFELLSDDTYAIKWYKGSTKNLTEIVIPKTFEGKKITALGSDNLDLFIKKGKPQFALVLNENITEIKSSAFNTVGVTKVTGNTSNLSKIGAYAFSWANKSGGNTLDITLTYQGEIMTGDAVFNQTKVTLHISHATTFSNTEFRAKSVNFDFTDKHIYGEPEWVWGENYFDATAVFTCTNPCCEHTERLCAEFIGSSFPSVRFEGREYNEVKRVYRTEAGNYIVTVEGNYRGIIYAPEKNIEKVIGLKVTFTDKDGNKTDTPQYIWVAKETAEDGIVLKPDGNVRFTKIGEFHVQIRSADGKINYSPWFTIRSFQGNGYGPDDNEESSLSVIAPETDTPKTGDVSSTGAAAAVLLGSLTTALFLAKKHRRNEDE